MRKKIFIHVSDDIRTTEIVDRLISGMYEEFPWIKNSKVGVFSTAQLDFFIEEEERHDQKILTAGQSQSLQTMSSGERKKALLQHLLQKDLTVLIAVRPFDNLDASSQNELKNTLDQLSEKLILIQISNRFRDRFSKNDLCYQVSQNLKLFQVEAESLQNQKKDQFDLIAIPGPIKEPPKVPEILVKFKNVSVSFLGRVVLNKIDWTIKTDEFWQLIGPNGSGKSTLLNLITGDSHKGYGQDLTLFGYKKGTGESVWDIKSCIGYFSPAMVDRFRGYHTLEEMIISGLYDSIGLYTTPSEFEKNCALAWLHCIGLAQKKDTYFNTLSLGEKRLLLTARAMIKHPPLLILDEPTVGLDDSSSSFFVKLVNMYAKASSSTIIFVSHQREKELNPQQIFELIPGDTGSNGIPKFL